MSANQLTKEQRQRIWEALLAADLFSRYWGEVARTFQRIDRTISIVLAASSLGAVGSFYLVKDYPKAWSIFSVITAIVACGTPFFNLGGTVEQCYHVQAKWLQFQLSYQQLWDNIDHIDGSQAFETFQEIQRQQNPLAQECSRLPNWEKLKRKMQKDVLEERRPRQIVLPPST